MPTQPEIGSLERSTPPPQCSLYLAFGRDEPCVGKRCIFFRVPGIDGCAVEAWRPGVQDDQSAAGWFLTRRLEAEDVRARREAPLRSVREPVKAAARAQFRARPGDHLLLGGHQLGEPDRDGEILAAIGDDGRPPYRVRWGVNDHVSTVYPGSEARIERL
jgi:hypothetical protein